MLVAEKTDLPKHACKGQNDCKGQGKVHAEALKADRFLAAAELNTPRDGRVPAEMRDMTLLELQRRMAEDLRRPLTSNFEMQETAADGESVDEIAESYIAPNARLSSFERLEIYNRQYWFRLISAIAEDFPTLNAVLGQKRFDALILAYLAEKPFDLLDLTKFWHKAPSIPRRPS